MRSTTFLFAALLCGLFLLPAGSGEPSALPWGLPLGQGEPAADEPADPADATEPDESDEPEPEPESGPLRLAWAEFAERPRDLLRTPVRIRLQLAALPETWNPLATRFGAAEWVAVDAWSDEQMPWFREVWRAPEVRVFARRGSTVARQLAAARPHERFEAVVVVRELLGRRPWVEIHSAIRLHEHVPEGTVLHAGRAVRLMREGKWALAIAELERAAAAPLPDHARDDLRRLAAICERERARAGRDSTER